MAGRALTVAHMMSFKRHVATAVLVALAAAPVAHAQQLPAPEEAREIMRQYRERTRGTETVRLALRTVLSGRGVPGGIVLSPQCGEEERVARSTAAPPAGASLAEALDALVAAAPQYIWRSDDGVVNVSPAGTHTPLLDLRVARFRAANVRTPGEALGRLLETPEVREAIGRPEVGDLLLRAGLGYYDPNPNGPEGAKVFSVSLDGATVREALNAIARAHGRAMWTYRGNNCRGVNSFELGFSVW